ncbi:MAG TPA: cupin domain-containing protein [Candidatus Babeliales bacterium]|nr:cupin domain-containing protein [Candidatus Babeliales bacterium]
MKIVILGGTGLIGSKVVNLLRAGGHEVVAASPSRGINSITGEGLTEALTGAQVVVDVTNSPSFEDKAVLEFFETSTGNVLGAEAKTGVGHHVALSIVGTDQLPGSGYLRAKVAQEKLIKASPIPYTILRATQFFEFVGRIADEATSGQTVHLPPVLFQPIFSDDLAANLAKIAVAKPLNGTIEIAGPEAVPFDELVREYLAAHHDSRTVVTDEKAHYFGTTLEKRSLIPDENALLGSCHFADWLSRTATQKAAIEKGSAPASNLSGKAPKVVALLLCGIIFAALSLGDAAAEDSSTNKSKLSATMESKEAKVTQLFSKDLTDLPGKEGLMLLVEYPPGSTDPVHRHNAHGFIYVLEGSIVMQVKGGKEVTLTPGQTFYEGPEDVHVVGRNASETKSAKFLVIFVKDKGAPVLVPAN